MHTGFQTLGTWTRDQAEKQIVPKLRMEWGKNQALKDIPRWKKVNLQPGDGVIPVESYGHDYIRRNGYYIQLSELDKLPKEDE